MHIELGALMIKVTDGISMHIYQIVTILASGVDMQFVKKFVLPNFRAK